MKRTNIKNKKEGGYAVLELLFYISFFVVLTILVINAMIIMTRAFRETTIQAGFLQNGSIMERMSREIRKAYGVDATSTTTDLKLNTKDGDGNNKTVEFKLNGSDIQFFDAGSSMGNLNVPNTVVTGLTFTQIDTINGKAVKVLLTIRLSNDTSNRSVDFYDTIVLRGSY